MNMDPALSSLVADLFVAIQSLSGYLPPTVPPQVHRVPQAEISQQFCRGPCQIKAVYDPTLGVFIDDGLDVHNNVFARSILLHELVHHVQSVSGRFDLGDSECTRRNTAEQEAYFIQNRYLMEMNDGHRVAMTGWAARCNDGEVPTPKKQ
jgi:hypothetical protein